jgi:hypothetical protein
VYGERFAHELSTTVVIEVLGCTAGAVRDGGVGMVPAAFAFFIQLRSDSGVVPTALAALTRDIPPATSISAC